jgi:hypothetical protein
MDPAWSSLLIGAAAGYPTDFCGDAPAVSESADEGFSDVVGAAYAVEEGGLEDAGDAEGGRAEEDAEGGVGPDEEVLYLVSLDLFKNENLHLRSDRHLPIFRSSPTAQLAQM